MPTTLFSLSEQVSDETGTRERIAAYDNECRGFVHVIDALGYGHSADACRETA